MTSQNHEDVVISGVSCRLPMSDNMAEFQENLLNGVDMVTEGSSRWSPGLHGLPPRSGKLKDLSKFDAAFFGVHPKQANRLDPQIRMLLECTYEALVDAGVNPETVRGSKTGVFIGAVSSESQEAWSSDLDSTTGYTMTGCTMAMFANRLSYFFDFKGPSITFDTACSSGLLALEQALQNIRDGECDAAIVGGSHLCLNPATALQFLKLGMLSPDGKCKSFDADGNGYCRSEGIVSLYLQKAVTAKRVYCTVVHAKTNNDGYKPEGITFPSSDVQAKLILDVCRQAGINPATVTYVEAHGTGTKAGDTPELVAICDVFCKDRQEPLLIGSVKSNMGHAEPVSGLVAVAKVIIAMETRTLPGNLHYNSPNTEIPGLVNGQLKVVDCNTNWTGGLVGVNSFGFGGSNVHAVLRSNENRPTKDRDISPGKTKRLFVYSSRTKEGLEHMLNSVRSHQEDLNLHALINETAHNYPSTHPYRGYTILNGQEDINVQKIGDEHRPVWFVFGSMGSQWHGMGRSMMEIWVFKESIQRSDRVLHPFDIRLFDMVSDGDEEKLNNTTTVFVSVVAIQIALVDTLTRLGIKPDGIIGHSVGELCCAYADGCMTAEETILSAYWRGRCIETADLPLGGMAVVGLTWQEALEQCPSDVVPACHNAETTVTVSGSEGSVQGFVGELKQRNIFAKEVNSTNVAFHSHYMKKVAPSLRNALKKVIKTQKLRSKRWISSSIPESQWSTDLASFSSAEYLVNNLVSPVLFNDALTHVPNNAVVIEIGPHCILQSILKRSLSKDCCIVGMMNKYHGDNVCYCLSGLGKCYQNGVKLDPLSLCPVVNFPVPAGTPFISPLVDWDHAHVWDVPHANMFSGGGPSTKCGCVFNVDMSANSHYRYLIGHNIDGRVLFPATGYLVLAWKTWAKMQGLAFEQIPVRFDDLRFTRATLLPDNGKVRFEVTILPETGNFEIVEGGSITVSGIVTTLDRNETGSQSFSPKTVGCSSSFVLSRGDIYKELRLRGYEYGTTFQGILGTDIEGTNGQVEWLDNWITYLDAMVIMIIFSDPEKGLCLPTRIRSITIDPVKHLAVVKDRKEINKDMPVVFDKYCNVCVSGGVSIMGLHFTPVSRRQDNDKPITEKYSFVPYCIDTPVKQSMQLLNYVSSCSRYVFTGFNEILPILEPADMKTNNTIKSVLQDVYLANPEETSDIPKDATFTYLPFLVKLFGSTLNGGTLVESVQSILNTSRESLKHDALLNCLNQSECYKTCIDIVVENVSTTKMNILDISGSSVTDHVKTLLANHPLMKTYYTVAVKNSNMPYNNDVDLINWIPSRRPPADLKKADLVIASDVLRKLPRTAECLLNVAESVAEEGFILVQEVTQNFHLALPLDIPDIETESFNLEDRSCSIYCTADKWRHIFSKQGFEIIYERSDDVLNTLFLLRKMSPSALANQTVLNVSDLSCSWLDDLKQNMLENQTNSKGDNLWLVADDKSSGIVGMVNCLRSEPGGDRLRCILSIGPDSIPDLSVAMKTLIKTDLVMNIWSENRWGSFRHVSMKQENQIECEHAYLDVQTRGDLSSINWIQSPLHHFRKEDFPGKMLCTVHFASLNFRDVMLATGKLSRDAIPGNITNNECMLGMEFSGKDASGRSVMGIIPGKSLATTVSVLHEFMWSVPVTWSLQEAATVPVAYTTAYYALVVRGNIRHGERILVHSGSSSVGQAAISIALHYGCDVYITIGTTEKREYLKLKFPELKEEKFMNSRDTSFEIGVMTSTRGQGVDLVLNSLSEDKLQASLRVLSQHGRFLEIGKVDLSNNTAFGMAVLLKNISIHGILLDSLFEPGNHDWSCVSKCFQDGIQSGVVRPLTSKIFDRTEAESAFRFMAKGKHIGKVMIKIRDDNEPTMKTIIPAQSRTYCHPRKCYIITGGLGGFGLELAHWLIDRAARRLILTSRTGIRTGYQARKIKCLQGYGVEVTVSTRDVRIVHDVRCLLTETNIPIGGVFHLAMVLKDGLLENQSVGSFRDVCGPKVTGIVNIDKMTRALCKESCDWFVVFSSVSSGRGNIGQSNYGLANSFMERLCEQRKQDGYPGLAIQWGAVGDVGIARDMFGNNEAVVGGTRQQRITSCLATLDMFLSQSEPVVSSYVLADKQPNKLESSKRRLVEVVFNILGITDVDTVSLTTNLGDLGLDSLMVTEVKQTLERYVSVSMTTKAIRELTVNTLRDLSTSSME